MGTNYFCYEKKLGKKHIGKLSGGWAFAFHGYNDDDFTMKSCREWENYLLLPHVEFTMRVVKKWMLTIF